MIVVVRRHAFVVAATLAKVVVMFTDSKALLMHIATGSHISTCRFLATCHSGCSPFITTTAPCCISTILGQHLLAASLSLLMQTRIA